MVVTFPVSAAAGILIDAKLAVLSMLRLGVDLVL
jgi:hypothetical protein